MAAIKKKLVNLFTGDEGGPSNHTSSSRPHHDDRRPRRGRDAPVRRERPKPPPPGIHDVTDKFGQKVEDLMNASVLPGSSRKFKVNKVQRIYSSSYGLYLHHLGKMEAKNPPPLGFEVDTNVYWLNKMIKKRGANEVFLFHGTKQQFSGIIANEGFDERVSAMTGLYGAGIYFAENADKSDAYTNHPNAQMFLARVILGNPYKALTTGSFRRPPAINAQDPSKLHDSVIAISARKNNGQGSAGYQEFIVYDRYHCIPIFLIDYDRIQ